MSSNSSSNRFSLSRLFSRRQQQEQRQPQPSTAPTAPTTKAGTATTATPTKTMAPSLHPLLDSTLSKGDANFAGGVLRCLCAQDPVEVTLASNVAHNHACGCSKCWKPKGAVFSIVGVISRDNVKVTRNGGKLQIVDPKATIQRHACKECGVHLFGRIETPHAFHGLDFVHVELSADGSGGRKGWQEPQFAGFVSSIIEQGYPPSGLDAVRARLQTLGLQTYDVLSPPLMDLLATFSAKQAGTLKE